MLLLNETIPLNEKVRILWRGKNRISVTPFKPVSEPNGLAAIEFRGWSTKADGGPL